MMRSVFVSLLCFMMVVMPFSILAQGNIKVGDYVEFGSYLGTRILWRVMELKDGNPLLWSECVLCAKCFDAAESGKLGQGSNYAEGWGSNVWSKSNIREWLNSAGKVNWTTKPPVAPAIQGKNNYENEPGFLTGLSPAERHLLVPTERMIIGHHFHREIETTQDLVFLPTYEEVQNGGAWGLNDNSRLKYPSAAALAKYKDMAGVYDPKRGYGYQYFLMTPDEYNLCTVRAVTFEGTNSDEYGANHSSVGIVPAIRISGGAEPRGGDGSKKNPWKF